MKTIPLHRHAFTLTPESARVIIRPFIPSSREHINAIIGRALAFTDKEAEQWLEEFHEEFGDRHFDIESSLISNYLKITSKVTIEQHVCNKLELIIGALFSGEYALESAALFNPSMVTHPDQSKVQAGELRFIMSLRATGEGHISSIEFREGVISSEGKITLAPISRYVTTPEVLPNPSYLKESFLFKLNEMGLENDYAHAVLSTLDHEFTLQKLNESIGTVRHHNQACGHELKSTLEGIHWLAKSNYELRFSSKLNISERIIFPVSPNESNGIEDARFVRFEEEDGDVLYYATYTAYNGRDILPMLIETEDFLHFKVRTLNGSAVQNKGMALFPRRINGQYAMLSRQDDENILIMFSDNPHYWNEPQVLMRPEHPWESVKIGNCGSPIETEAGWLVITHGVGPMRKYCIGVALLDLEDPTKVIGRLKKPLLSPDGDEREGYVPNVVYSCGSLIHNGQLILPYAMSDLATAAASIPMEALLAALQAK